MAAKHVEERGPAIQCTEGGAEGCREQPVPRLG